MKLTTVKLSLISAAALALTASQSFAQSNAKVLVKVPFEFVAGATTLPAGTYNFSEDRVGVMHISSADNGKAIVVLTSPEAGVNGSELPSVRFDKVNGQYALTEVSIAGELSHRVVRTDDKGAAFSSRLGVTNAAAKSLR